MSRIPLLARDGTVRGYALVDAGDVEWLSQWTWRLHSGGYAMRGQWCDGRYVTFLMHRCILGLDPGDPLACDHINRQRLDNRRANLRVVTHAANRQNVPSQTGSSRFRGVCFVRGRWRAAVTLDYRFIYLGSFDDEEEAARVAADFRAEHMPFSEDALRAA